MGIIKPLQKGSLLHGQSYNYVVEEVLGQGSFGITYLARVQMHGALGSLDSQMRVAVKEFFMKEVNGRDGNTVTMGTDSGIFVDYKKKFRAEAEHLAQLKHQHIINVMEFFEENNTVYYVMEYIEGGSLDDYIKHEGRLPETTALDYTRQIGEALQFMHQHSMLHLDLKPANIMRRKDGTLVLIDFGLSKQFDANGDPESSTTIGGGTPGYAPLEQATYRRGDGLPVTMDVYALGATAYKMLTGQRPPNADAVLNDGFPYSSFASLQVNRNVVDVIAKAMSPVRKSRFQSVSEMLAAFGQDGATLTSTSQSPSPALGKPSAEQNVDDTIIDPRNKTQRLPQDKPNENSTVAVTSNRQNGHSGGEKQSQSTIINWKILAVIGVVALAIGGFLLLKGKEESDQKAKEQEDRTVSQGVEYGAHYYVDLGLPSGTKWATMNVGASSPSDYGDYFAWGETSPKSNYDWSNLKYCLDNSGDKFSKYVTDSRYGNVDGKKELDLSDDAAYVNWGEGWCMPSEAQQDELREKCTWTWTSMGGHDGYKVVGPNGNSLFLPAAGYRNGSSSYGVGSSGDYWSRSLYLGGQWSAYYLDFNSGDVDWLFGYRSFGRSVRPVLGF